MNDKVTSVEIKEALAIKHYGEFFITECKTGPTQFGPGMMKFDGLAIYKSWVHPKIRGYEIKVSRSDFLSDAKFYNYIPYCHEFYFVVPSGLIDRTEIPKDAGLIYYNPKTKSLTTKKCAPYRNIEISSDMLMYIFMNRLDSDRIPFYSSKKEFFKKWVENKEDNHELGRLVKSKMADEIIRLQKLVDDEKYNIRKAEELNEIIAFLDDHKIGVFWEEPLARIKNQLEKGYPCELDEIMTFISNIGNKIERIKQGYKENQNDEH